MMSNSEFIELQIGSILRNRYFSNYQLFENKIREIFEKAVSNIDSKMRHKLYFFHGFNQVKNLHVKYNEYSLDFHRTVFKEEDEFKSLTILNIIRIDRKEKFIESFNFVIDSLMKSLDKYPFHDSAIKLINMRNLLAHKPIEADFIENKCIIEHLSKERLRKNEMFYWGSYDMSNLSVINQQIFSNLIYLKTILNKLGDIKI